MMPISWEGWLVTAIFVAILYVSAHINHIIPYRATTAEFLNFLLDVSIFTSLFLLLFKEKTNGKLGWRWGKKKWF